MPLNATYTKEEQKAHRAALTAALRSGEYEQARDKLKVVTGDHASFCCLGVGCEISRLGTWTVVKDGWAYVVGDHYNRLDLPEPVRHYYGFAGTNGRFGEPSPFEYLTLSGKNDIGWSFKMIADLIDSEPEGLLEP